MIKPPAKRVIGIDYGMARIGLAYSDESQTIAMPLKIIRVEKKSNTTIQTILKELKTHQKELGYEIEAFVVGLPLLMSGKMGLLADEVKHFVALLKEASQLPIIMWDERLSSVQAERSMREFNITRKRRSKMVDTVAAVIILQNYLDTKKLTKESES